VPRTAAALIVLAGLLSWVLVGRSSGSTPSLRSCAVTLPNAERTPYDPARGPQTGNGWLWVSAYPFGITRANKSDVGRDGKISIKFAWYRKQAGRRLTISARRLDARAAPGRPFIPPGYGSNFQASGITFPSEGCWRVTGRVGRHSLTFVTIVLEPGD
jgi:hypothetical protein